MTIVFHGRTGNINQAPFRAADAAARAQGRIIPRKGAKFSSGCWRRGVDPAPLQLAQSSVRITA